MDGQERDNQDSVFFKTVTTTRGDILVTTKVKFYGLFSRPRTYVIREGFAGLGGPLGFQVRYNTSESRTLAQFHQFWVKQTANVDFDTLVSKAKQGVIELPSELQHLAPYVIGFNA